MINRGKLLQTVIIFLRVISLNGNIQVSNEDSPRSAGGYFIKMSEIPYRKPQKAFHPRSEKVGLSGTGMNFPPATRLLLAFVLITLGILGRTIFHLGDNIEFVTSSTLLAASFLGFRWAVIVPLVIMAVSDFIIGNTLIFLFTWSAYLLTGLLGFFFLTKKSGIINHVFKATGTGIISSIIFYLWTNFGVWLLDSFGMYSDNLSGLLDSYIMGIPFFKANLYGNLIFVPLSFFIFHLCLSLQSERSSLKKILFSN